MAVEQEIEREHEQRLQSLEKLKAKAGKLRTAAVKDVRSWCKKVEGQLNALEEAAALGLLVSFDGDKALSGLDDLEETLNGVDASRMFSFDPELYRLTVRHQLPLDAIQSLIGGPLWTKSKGQNEHGDGRSGNRTRDGSLRSSNSHSRRTTKSREQNNALSLAVRPLQRQPLLLGARRGSSFETTGPLSESMLLPQIRRAESFTSFGSGEPDDRRPKTRAVPRMGTTVTTVRRSGSDVMEVQRNKHQQYPKSHKQHGTVRSISRPGVTTAVSSDAAELQYRCVISQK